MSYDDSDNVIPIQPPAADLNGHGSLNGHNPGPAKKLPEIETHDRQLSSKREETIAAIDAANVPPRLFHSDGGLATIGIDKDGLPAIRPALRDAIQNLMADAANWYHTTGNGKRKITPPRDLADNFLAQDSWPKVPALDGIVTAPIFAADGTLCDQPGYNKASRLWLSLPTDFQLPDTSPTPENLAWAREIIFDTLLGEVAFADEASKAHAVGLMLLPFVRQLIPGPTPLNLFDAPSQSSGKSYTAKICISPFARPVASVTKGEEEEWRKAILAALLSGRAHVFFDNVKGTLNSPMLAAAITEPHIVERGMGGLKEVKAAVRCCWVATSNNATLDSDAASRCIVIRLDTCLETPEGRTFTHDPLSFIQQYRADVIGAILIFVRLWQAEGSPLYQGEHHSRFPQWQAIIGGILGACDIPGFLGNLQQFRSALDPEKAAWVALTEAWHEQFGLRYVTAKDLIPFALDIPEIADTLGQKEGPGQTRSLGRQLQLRRDKVFGPMKIHAGIAGRSGQTYRLLPIGNDPEDGDRLPDVE